MDAVKLSLEDAALQSGIEILYRSFPVGIAGSGFIIGNKSGRQVAGVPDYCHATARLTLVAKMAGAEVAFVPCAATYYRTVEFDPVGAIELAAFGTLILRVAGNAVG